MDGKESHKNAYIWQFFLFPPEFYVKLMQPREEVFFTDMVEVDMGKERKSRNKGVAGIWVYIMFKNNFIF